MLEKVLDLKNTFEGKFLAVLMSVILVLSMTNIMAFAGDTSQQDASASDASVPAETAPESSNALVNEPSAKVPVSEPVVEAPALSPEVGEALVTFETENAYVSVNDQVLSGTTLTTQLHKELAFVAAPDSGFEIDSIKAHNAANAEVPVTTQDGISKIAADYVDSTLVVTVTGKAVEAQVETPVTDPITSDTKIETEETIEAPEAPEAESSDAPKAPEASELTQPEANTSPDQNILADVSNPAFEGYAQAGNVLVKVTAAEGVLPADTTVQAVRITSSSIISVVEDAVESQGKELEDAVAIDVTLIGPDGNVIQPTAAVNVCFFNSGISGEAMGVYHVANDGSSIDPVVARQVDSVAQSFDVNHFSIYVVTAEGTPHLATYNFYGIDGSLLGTQIVKTGDVLYEPENPIVDEGSYFQGWYAKNGDEWAGKFDAFGEQIVTETATFDLYAKSSELRYVYFMDGQGRVYTTKSGVQGDVIAADVSFPLAPGEGITGWFTDESLTHKVESVQLDASDVTLYPKVETGSWITFDSNGGSYITPTFVGVGGSSSEPAAPTRAGYRFEGWYDNEACQGNAYAFGSLVDGDVTLFAKWKAETASYRVVVWLEAADSNADAPSYDYVTTLDYEGTTDAVVPLPGVKEIKASVNAFVIDKQYILDTSDEATDETVTVRGDGSAIANVYLNRVEYTIDLQCSKKKSENVEDYTSEYKITANYGADISAEWAAATEAINAKYGARVWAANPNDAGTTSNPVVAPFQTMTENRTLYYVNNGNALHHLGLYVEQVDNVKPIKQDSPENKLYWNKGYRYSNNYDTDMFDLEETIVFKGSGVHASIENYLNALNGFEWVGADLAVHEGFFQVNGVWTARHYFQRKAYTITYNNEGAVSTSESIKYGASIADRGAEPNAKDAGVPEGSTFGGWYTSPTFAEGTEFDFSDATMPANNLILYAKWIYPTYKVTYYKDAAGTTGAKHAVVDYGEKATNEPSSIADVPEGYKWVGWMTRSGSEGNYTYMAFNFDTQIFGDVELYPYYINDEKRTLTYDANGGQGDVPVDGRAYAQGSFAKVAESGLTPPTADQTFLNWNTEKDGTGAAYYPGGKVQLGESDVTLYAQWGLPSPRTTLTYDPNGGSGVSLTLQDIPNNGELVLKSAEELNFAAPRPGMHLAGWSTEKDGSGALYEAGTTARVDIKEGANILYAQWAASAASIVFVENGGTNVLDMLGVTYQEIADRTMPTTTRDGYTFAGWYQNEQLLGEPVAELPDSYPIGVTTYWAKWVPAEDTAYKIEVYYQAEGQYGEPEVFAGQGTTGADAHISQDAYVKDGYVFDKNAHNVLEKTIAADGSTVLKVYYKQQFTVTFEPGVHAASGSQAQVTTGIDYGAPTPVAPSFEAAPGYSFAGWSEKPSQIVTDNAVYTAQWDANTAKVSVWFRAAGDTAFFVDTTNQIAMAGSAVNKFSKSITTENKSGYSEEELTSWAGEAYALTTDVEERYAGYELGVVRNGSWTKINNLASFTIEQGDELRYYVLPEFAHTLTYQAGMGTGDALTDASPYYSKDTVAVKSFEDTGFTAPAGYAFDHWQVVSDTGSLDGDTFTMGAGDAVLEAVYKAVEVNYTVEHYKVNADGTGADLVASDTQALQELTGASVSAEANTYPGYTYQPAFDQHGMKTVASGEVAGDGSLVLKLYYTPNSDELVYDGNSATSGATTATTGKVDQQVSVAANGFEREGYEFVGWNTAADGTGIAYAVNDAYVLTPGDDVLYAQWKADFSNLKAEGFSVTYDGQSHAVTVVGTLPTDTLTYTVERSGESAEVENSFVNVLDMAKVTVTVVRGGESITLEPVTAEIKPVEVTITVDNQSKTFGDADPAFTGSVSGVLANDLGLGDVTFGRAEADQGKEAVGDDITLVPTYTENPNYTVTVNPGKLTIVESGALSLSATGYEGTYDGQNHGIAVNTNLESDLVTIEYSTDDGQTWTTAAPSAKDVADSATYQVRATAAGYKTATVQNVALTIKPAQVAVTANDANKLFGETDPQLTYTPGAAVAGETPGFAGALEREAGEAVGEYAISQGALALADNGAFKAANYELVFAPGTFTIAQKLGTVNVEKVWQNPGGAIAENPAVELQLYQDGQPYGEPVTLANGVTTHVFAELPQGKSKAETGNGATAHEYTVVETSIGGASVVNGAASVMVPGIDGAVKYTSQVEAVAGGFIITNARTSVIVELLANTTDRTVARSESLAHAFLYHINGSTHQLSGAASVKKAIDPGTLNVSVEAKPTVWNTTYAVDGGAAKQGAIANVSALTDLKVSFTNDRVPLRYNIHKLWFTDDPSTLPDSLAIEVFQSADQNEPYTPNGNRYETTLTGWEPAGQGVYEKTVAYDKLFPRAALDGALYHYSAVEELPENYLEPGNGHTNWSADEGSVDADDILSFTGDLYNYYNVTSVSGTKTWEDFGREVTHDNATEVQLVLERSSDRGVTWTEVDATPTWNGDRYTFSGLEKYTELPFANQYRVTEQPVEGYVTTQNGDNFTNRAVRTLAIEAGSNSWTYDGMAHGEDSYQLTIDGAEPIAVGEGGTYTFPNGDVLTVTVEGSVTNVADTQSGNNQVTGWTLVDANGTDISAAYQVSTTPGTLSITPADLAITVTGNRAQVTFDGQAHVVEGFTYDNGDKATVTLKDGVQARAEGTDVKTYPMGLTSDSFNVDAPNYNVTLTVNDGQLEILPANVMTVNAPNVEAVYDGSGHATVAVPSVQDGAAQVRYFNEATGAYDLEVAPEFTNAGSYTVRFQATHPNYNPAEGSATVVVKPRSVVLTSATAEKTYDGQPLSAESVQVGGEGFAPGEGAAFSNFATITDAGTAENAFAYTLNANTLAGNYVITSTFGTLEVKPAALTVRIEGAKKTVEYTGDLQSVEGYRVLDDVAGKATIALKPGSAAFASGVAVGDYPMNLTADSFAVTSTNYRVTLEVTDGNLTITPAGTLAVSANPVSAIYDGANHGVEAVASVPGATVKYWSDETNDYTLDASPTFRDVTGEPKTVKFKASLANYDDAYGETTVEVTPRPVTLTSASATKMYDGQPLVNSQMSVGGLGFVAGEEPAVSVTGSQTDAGTSKNTFTYAFPQNVQAGNYAVTTVEGDLTVQKAPLAVTVTGNHDTRTYDGTPQSVEGFTTDAGDKATVTLKNGALARAEGTDAGTYPMGLTPANFDVASQNYEVTLTVTDGWLTILPAGVMQVNADNVEKTYDGARVGIEAKASVEGATIRYYNEATGAFDLAQSPTFLDAGTYEVRFQATHPNYETAEGAAAVVVKPRAVTLTSASAEKVYDGQPLMAASVQEGGEGFVSGEGATYDGFAGIADAGTADNVFSYELGANTKPENYVITTQVGVLTVHKAPLAVTVTGAQAFATYDGAAHAANGFTDDAGDKATVTLKDGALARAEGTGAGTYAMGLTPASFEVTSQNYEVTLTVVDGSLEVGPASLLIAANDASKSYGQDDPALLATVKGLVAGDEFNGAYTLVRDAGEAPGSYGIEVRDAVSHDPNYTVQTAPGVFTITPAEGVTLVVTGGAKVYDGTPLEPAGFTATGLAAGDVVEAVLSGEQTDAGTSEAGVESFVIRNAAGADVTASYANVTVVSGTLTVTPAAAVIAVADAAKTAGAADPTFTGTVTGLVQPDDLGEIAYVRTNTDEVAGVYADVLTATYTENPNYVVEVIPGTFTITAAPVTPVTPVTPPVTPTPTTPTTPTAPVTPGTVPPDAPPIVAPVVEALQNAVETIIPPAETPLAEPQEQTIADDENPLAGYDRVNCWVHYYLILGIIVTLLYGAGVLARRLRFAHKLKALENDVLGIEEAAAAAPAAPLAPTGKEA